jgi:uracil phosphoribosyltransferase
MAVDVIGAEDTTPFIREAIALCKSDSGVCGTKLRNAHKVLGGIIGARIARRYAGHNRAAVVVMMRAGLPFAIGIADGLEESGRSASIFFSAKEKPTPGGFDAARFDMVIIADAVIRTGMGMLELAAGMPCEKIIFAANVLDETGIINFAGHTVFAVRISKNSFIGSKQKAVSGGRGPDTGDRLFSSDF